MSSKPQQQPQARPADRRNHHDGHTNRRVGDESRLPVQTVQQQQQQLTKAEEDVNVSSGGGYVLSPPSVPNHHKPAVVSKRPRNEYPMSTAADAQQQNKELISTQVLPFAFRQYMEHHGISLEEVSDPVFWEEHMSIALHNLARLKQPLERILVPSILPDGDAPDGSGQGLCRLRLLRVDWCIDALDTEETVEWKRYKPILYGQTPIVAQRGGSQNITGFYKTKPKA